jgi:glycosyltransferase involved in cell wall biosynthesis
LKQVNQGILAKYAMTIVQMHLIANDEDHAPVSVERCGLGRIVWIPIKIRNLCRGLRSLPSRLAAIRSEICPVSKLAGYKTMLTRTSANSFGHLRYSAMVMSERLALAMREFQVDLMVFHWRSYEIPYLIGEASKQNIPCVYIHHFDNGRLASPESQKALRPFVEIAGVSARNVPSNLEGRFHNLSDAIDIEFFSPQRHPNGQGPEGFVITLPARILPGKGHLDLLDVASVCLKEGVPVRLVFAGATDSSAFIKELKDRIQAKGLTERVSFVGELSALELKNWYAHSHLVVLPSHSEGLGRVLLEAQAMEVPVIAYATGGMTEAVLDAQTGFLVPVGDTGTFVNRVKYLFSNPAIRLNMGKAGRAFVTEKFSQDALVERHEIFYSKALHSRNACTPAL